VRRIALENGAVAAETNTAVTDGGDGAADLARAVVAAANSESKFEFTYPDEMSLKEKIEAIAIKCTARRESTSCPRPQGKLKRFTEAGSATSRSAWRRRTCRSRTTLR